MLEVSDICAYTRTMATVSIRDLSRNASSVVDDVARTGRPALVTKHGAPIAAVVPIDSAELEDLVLAKAAEYLDDLTAADEDLATGRTQSAADVFADLSD